MSGVFSTYRKAAAWFAAALIVVLCALFALPASAWADGAGDHVTTVVCEGVAGVSAGDSGHEAGGAAGAGGADDPATDPDENDGPDGLGDPNAGASAAGANGANPDDPDADVPDEDNADDPDDQGEGEDDGEGAEGDDSDDPDKDSKPADETPATSTPAPAATQAATPAAATTNAANSPLQDTGVTMYRLYNPYSGEHFYTSSVSERNSVVNAGWRYEGIGWIAPSSGAAVYRLYNPYERLGDHHYTMSAAERDWLVKQGWRYEGICWRSGGSYKVLRQYNPYAYSSGGSGAHNYTVSKSENDGLVRVGWRAEGVGWYALADTQATLAANLVANSAAIQAIISYNDENGVQHEYTVTGSLSGDTYYVCLPSFADPTTLKVSAIVRGATVPVLLAASGSRSFTTLPVDQAVDVTRISGVMGSNGARLFWYTTNQTSLIQRLGIMVSAKVGSMYITSVNPAQGRGYVEASPDHSVSANVTVVMIGADGAMIYNKDTNEKSSTIKGRGNNTWGIGDKKPYQISLNKKADLLCSGNADNANKKWLLLANANDVTMLHSTIAYNMGLELGLIGTECIPIDLYYDGVYRGTYLLCEKVQINKGRIVITDLEDLYDAANEGIDMGGLTVRTATNTCNGYTYTYTYVVGINDPDDITGGYLLELDNAYYSSEICRFNTKWGVIVVKSPEYCSQAAMKYISECFIKAIDNLYAGVVDGGENTFDLDTLAKSYLINEFSKNIDAFYTSTFFYKEKGDSRFYAQPLWDFDACMGVRSDHMDWTFATYSGFVLPSTQYVPGGKQYAVAYIPVVQAKAREIWTNQLSPLIKNVLLSNNVNAVGENGFLHSIGFYRQQISASQKMNQTIFGLTAFENEVKPYETYDANYNYLVNWLGWRTAWFDDNISKLSGSTLPKTGFWDSTMGYDMVFDASYYKKVNPDLSGLTDDQAFQHFLQSGMKEGRVASRNFNVKNYKSRYADLRAAFGDNYILYYQHYVQYGFKEGRNAL